MSSKQLALVDPSPPQPATLDDMARLAKELVASGMLPDAIKRPEQALAIMLKGRELGIPAMQAFSHIHVIQGKPTIAPELMLALIFRKYPKAHVQYVQLDKKGCRIMAARPGMVPVEIGFDEEDAKAAGLIGKDNWRKYARAMYRSRAIAEMARAIFPDAISGASYTPEELGAEVTINDAGEMTNVTPVEAPRPSRPGYDPDDPQKVAWLEKALDAHNIPKSRHVAIAERMIGRPSADLLRVVDELAIDTGEI